MHELSIAQEIVDSVAAAAAEARVTRINVEIGTLSCVLPESLAFCFEALAAETPLRDAQLQITRVPGRSRCRDCGAAVTMDDNLARCACGSLNLEPPQGGDELRILSIELLEAA